MQSITAVQNYSILFCLSYTCPSIVHILSTSSQTVFEINRLKTSGAVYHMFNILKLSHAYRVDLCVWMVFTKAAFAFLITINRLIFVART